MIKALQDDFVESCISTDENSKAYSKLLKGEDPNSSSSHSHTHVASRLLSMFFLDICKASGLDIGMNNEVVIWRAPPLLKYKVCSKLHLLQVLAIMTCCGLEAFWLGDNTSQGPQAPWRPREDSEQGGQYKHYCNHNQRWSENKQGVVYFCWPTSITKWCISDLCKCGAGLYRDSPTATGMLTFFHGLLNSMNNLGSLG